MRSVTVDDVMSWEPCDPYTTERVKSLFAGRARVTALDVCAMDIPVKDVLWAVLREDMIEGRMLHLFACWCAEQTLQAEREAGREPDSTSWAAIEVKHRWVDGAASDDELAVARADAWKNVARTVAWSATLESAQAAAGGAARDASWFAAWAAVLESARANVGASAWSAAQDRQLHRLVEMLEEVPE